jgi:molybdopterin-guanine dinucleotide biosynthesis protein A
MLGVILAGGHARRLGSDKAHLRLEGEPLYRRQIRVLREAGAERVVIVRRPEQAAPPGIECRRDQWTNAGPLAGLQAALGLRAAVLVAVLAVDMPGIAADWFHWLRRACRPGRGAMARHDGICEPLAAIYPAEALDEIERRLAQGDYSLQRLAAGLAAAERMALLPLPHRFFGWSGSINTPADLERFRSRTLARSHAATD